ncbi:CopD family protein [Sulfuriflexus sp.]|uniref:CopD family protein n=1 Tax=Sulfuriflexus sp. TaxID=2015443 RepID=UPI0028CC0E1E|nr:CopD family protein [Sulfuriflexus sp.]MDT8405345.1 CopD family protein [Sulfuriflexus sp.]
MSLAISLHMLAATIWVGGMFFAYMALRPVAASQLEPPQRLPLWKDVFGKFFPWVWLSLIVLLGSGYWMAFKLFGGFATFPLYVNIMQGLGIIMVLLYMHVFFAPYKRMKQAIAAGDLSTAGAKLAQIRMIIGVNLSLGLIVTAVASGGRYL